jgi:hypothetical protein
LPRVIWFRAKANKILIECSLSNQFSEIGKGEVSSIVNSVTTLWCFIKVIGIYPGYGSGHHAEVERVGNGMMVSGLTFELSISCLIVLKLALILCLTKNRVNTGAFLPFRAKKPCQSKNSRELNHLFIKKHEISVEIIMR